MRAKAGKAASRAGAAAAAAGAAADCLGWAPNEGRAVGAACAGAAGRTERPGAAPAPSTRMATACPMTFSAACLMAFIELGVCSCLPIKSPPGLTMTSEPSGSKWPVTLLSRAMTGLKMAHASWQICPQWASDACGATAAEAAGCWGAAGAAEAAPCCGMRANEGSCEAPAWAAGALGA